MPVDDTCGQFAAHLVEVLHAHLVFEARDRRLRGEGGAENRIPPEQQLVNRVVGQPVGIIRIGMAAGEPEDALRQQIRERVTHLPRLPVIDEAAGEPLDQSGRQQNLWVASDSGS